jgi:hypothetical protein
MTDVPLPPRKIFIPQLLMTLFLRLVALVCLWYGLRLWGDLIGYTHHGSRRFDLLANDLKAANATLAALSPVAAIGLWLRGAWGPVIWSAGAVLEIVMHEFLKETFGADPVMMITIAVTAVIYVALRLVILFMKPPARATVYG